MKLKPLLVKVFALAIIFSFCSFESKAQEPKKEEAKAVQSEQKVEKSEAAKPGKKVSKPLQEDFLKDKFVSMGLKLGGTVSPESFTMAMNIDFLLDGMFSLGPYFQTSFKNGLFYFSALLDGKFRIEVFLDELRLNVLMGGGYIYSRINSIGFHDMVAHVGLGGEYFINDFISAGLEITSNHTSNVAEKFFLSILAGMNFYL